MLQTACFYVTNGLFVTFYSYFCTPETHRPPHSVGSPSGKTGLHGSRKRPFGNTGIIGSGMTNCRVTGKKDIAEHIPVLWKPLSEGQREYLLAHIELRKFRKDEAIYNENDTPRYFMCLIEGKVKVYKDGASGRQIVRIVQETAFFGYRAACAEGRYLTGASAFEDSLVCLIPVDVVRKLMLENSTMAMYFLKQLAKGLGEADTLMVNLTQKHIRGRLAESLLLLRDRYGVAEDGVTLNARLSREDLANMSNMTTGNAIRTLSAFASEGIVGVEGRKISIKSESGLRSVSDMG